MTAGRTIWQIAGGSGGRSYADIFLKHGVALVGPGEIGPCDAARLSDETYDETVKRFVKEVSPGDVLLLRTGVNRVLAIGLVAGAYEYLRQFDDVNGWDLEHSRRVRWYPLPVPLEPSAFVFGANPPRLSRSLDQVVSESVERFLNSEPRGWQSAPLPPLPVMEPRLEAIPSALQEVVGEALDLVGLYGNLEQFGGLPSEKELVAHLVIPFLRALGWPRELIGVEWCAVDVCVFDRLPRTPENTRFIIEAKRLGAAVEGALGQAKGYVAVIGHPRDIIVTDGVRYRLYSAAKEYEPVAYANLSHLKRSAAEFFDRLRR